MANPPAFSGDWEALARFTRKLLADRRASYHEEDDRIRIMAAIAEVWRCVEAQEDVSCFEEFDQLGAYWFEMLADIEVLAERAKARADRAAARSDVEENHKRATAITAALADTLLHYHRPYHGGSWGTPMIAFCHSINQEFRARRKQAERHAA